MALKHHPDKNGNSKESTEMFKPIGNAYETLIDPEKRAFYDHELKAKADKERTSGNEKADDYHETEGSTSTTSTSKRWSNFDPFSKWKTAAH